MSENEIAIHIPGYDIIRPIGHGGMATVYLANQQSIDRHVAIKVMSPALASDPSFSERFVKEARMANLSHPHIITVYDAGVADGQNYIIMELASGGNLDSAIHEGLTAVRIIDIIASIASALEYSCNKGFIHRDVKPENILFKEDGSALLVDFGIAKAVTSATRLTMVGNTIGSPNYMSPEQARGLPLDGRSDLYSLGIVFYEALTGIKPYDASDTFVIGLKHINDPIPQLPPNVKKFQPIIDRLLAKDPAQRFENGSELNTALKEIQLDDTDYDIVPITANTYDDVITQINESRQDTQLSPEFGEKETAIVGAVGASDDTTRVLSSTDSERDDKTQVLPQNDKTVVLPRNNQATQTPNSKTVLVTTVVVMSMVVAGVVFWWLGRVPTEVVTIPEPLESAQEKVLDELKDDASEKLPSEDLKPAPIIAEDSDKTTPSLEKTEDDASIISSYLSKADKLLTQNKLTSPKDENAHTYYQKVIALEQDNQRALAGIDAIAEKYYGFADRNAAQRKLNKALNLVDKGLRVKPKDDALIALREDILAKIKTRKEKKTVTRSRLPNIQKNDVVFDLVGRHHGKTFQHSERFSRASLSNKIYYLNFAQCHANLKLFESTLCKDIYFNFIRQWPIALKAEAYSESARDKLKLGKVVFNEQEAKEAYASINAEFLSLIEAKDNSISRLALANHLKNRPIKTLMGLAIDERYTQKWETIRDKRATKNRIGNVRELIKTMKSFVGNDKVYIAPFTSHRSMEVTPFASALYQTLVNALTGDDNNIGGNELRGELRLAANGNVTLSVWLFDLYDDIIKADSFTLDKSIADNKRLTNIFFNESLFPDAPLDHAFGFPADIKIGDSTSNALLLVGDETTLSVKLENPGFFFIAVHVVRMNEQFSYLLPLRQGKVPFVQVALRNQRYQYQPLGSFDITAPTGVETIQLIASSINLEKYLPSYDWNEKRQQYIVRRSEGDVAKGIAAVRQMANKIHQSAHDKTVQWQERLLVTTILEKDKL